MRFTHNQCGGEIDVEKRICRRCKKKWNPISFRLDPTGIRPMLDKKGKLVIGSKAPRQLIKGSSRIAKSYSKWAYYLPGVVTIASKFPNWSRWMRVLVTVVILLAVLGAILILRR